MIVYRDRLDRRWVVHRMVTDTPAPYALVSTEGRRNRRVRLSKIARFCPAAATALRMIRSTVDTPMPADFDRTAPLPRRGPAPVPATTGLIEGAPAWALLARDRAEAVEVVHRKPPPRGGPVWARCRVCNVPIGAERERCRSCETDPRASTP